MILPYVLLDMSPIPKDIALALFPDKIYGTPWKYDNDTKSKRESHRSAIDIVTKTIT